MRQLTAPSIRHSLSRDEYTLCQMHTYKRPHGSGADRAFCDRYIKPLPGAYRDQFGNWHVEISDAPVLWSCHTDTVHTTSGRQHVAIGADRCLALNLPWYQSRAPWGTCLGADDTAGVWLAIEMIRAHVPGWYIFHYGEERGGIGSSALARHYGDWLSQRFTIAIALDRAGTSDVITRQAGGRTASDTFAWSLAAQLPGAYRPCPHGMYTDTAEYADLIAECTNVSVGYERAHSGAEYLDVDHLFALRDALIAIDVTALVVDRQPGDNDPLPIGPRYAPFKWHRFDDDDDKTDPYAELTIPIDGDFDYLDHDYLAVQTALWRQLRAMRSEVD